MKKFGILFGTIALFIAIIGCEESSSNNYFSSTNWPENYGTDTKTVIKIAYPTNKKDIDVAVFGSETKDYVYYNSYLDDTRYQPGSPERMELKFSPKTIRVYNGDKMIMEISPETLPSSKNEKGVTIYKIDLTKI